MRTRDRMPNANCGIEERKKSPAHEETFMHGEGKN